jgi:hypothetical protein
MFFSFIGDIHFLYNGENPAGNKIYFINIYLQSLKGLLETKDK